MSTFADALKETLRDVLADRYAKATLIGAIVLYSAFYPMAYRHQVTRDLPVAVVNQDHGPASRTLIRHLDAIRTLHIAGMEPSVTAAREGLQKGTYEGILVIPDGFERDIARGLTGHVVVLANGAFLSRGSNVVGALNDVGRALGAEVAVQSRQTGITREPSPISLIQRPLFNVREGYGSGVVPGVAEIIVHQTLLIGIGVILGGRRQRNGGRRLRYPAAQWSGILAGFACIGLPALLYYAGFTFWAQDYPRGGNPLGLVVMGPLYIAATVAFGMFVGSWFSRREHAFQFITGISLVLFFLSNLTWPVPSSPQALVWVAKLLPSTPGVTGLIKVNQLGASLQEAWPQIANLLVLVVLYSSLVAWRFWSPGAELPIADIPGDAQPSSTAD